MATDQEMLAQVKTAILAQLTGNAAKHSVGNQSIEKLPLGELRQMEAVLKRKLGRAPRRGRKGGPRMSGWTQGH